LIAFYSVIYQGINGEIIPNSIFAFNDGVNTARYDKFYFDEAVKSIRMQPLRFLDNVTLYSMFILGITIPLAVGFILSVLAAVKFRAAKRLLVKSACENEARGIQMKTAGASGADVTAIDEFVSDEMRNFFDRKIGVFYALEYLWAEPDVDQSVLTKICVSFTHCVAVAIATTPMVVFAELYQKSYVSNNCPFSSNPDQCQSYVTLILQGSSTLVKIFPISAALELVCYNARFPHSYLRRLVYLTFCASAFTISCVSIACLMAFVLWSSFAVVSDPQKVIPFFMGGASVVVHALRLYPVATSARDKVRKALQQRSLQITSRLTGTLPLPLMANIVTRQITYYLETQSLGLRAIVRSLLLSISGLILVITLLLLALSAFSAPSIVMCVVGSCSVVCAAVIAHRLAAARFRFDDDNLNGIAAASMISIKKSFDFVLRQMSQAARLLKAMEGNISSGFNNNVDGGSASDLKQKSYKQAAQMAIMHGDMRAPAPTPPSARPPIPRLWRQRAVVQPPSFSRPQLPLMPHVQQQVQDAVHALQAEARWPGVRASGAAVSERQIRLGIRTARALAEDLPPASVQQHAGIEEAFAAGVGGVEPRRGSTRRLVHTRTVRALSEAVVNSDADS
jgi:hypothetical protein